MVRPSFRGTGRAEISGRHGFTALPPVSHVVPMRFDPTTDRWRYDLRLFLLAYVAGLIAFGALIP